ncbi:hypothetical protein E2C01_086229 [Portunus trituberculatus]|uniref:Uncharacterized protein n=1 Tax=Portunus trituberculatus TaxID=210409 RepID=A0A5B7J8Q6_PORTR|nr:hypothetical protein [Portunus trituberculatus]
MGPRAHTHTTITTTTTTTIIIIIIIIITSVYLPVTGGKPELGMLMGICSVAVVPFLSIDLM